SVLFKSVYKISKKKGPSVSKNKYEQLDGNRHSRRRQHEHSQGHQYRGHKKIDRKKRQIYQKPDLKRGGKLAGNKRRHQEKKRHVLRLDVGFFISRSLKHSSGELDILRASLPEHKFTHWRLRQLYRFSRLDFAGQIWRQGLRIYFRKSWRHYRCGKAESHSGYNDIWRRLLQAERLSENRQDHDHPRERGKHHQNRWRQSHQGEQSRDFQRRRGAVSDAYNHFFVLIRTAITSSGFSTPILPPADLEPSRARRTTRPDWRFDWSSPY